jgi:hypothetical protein
MHAYIRTYIHTCVRACMHTYIHTHARTHALSHTHTHTHTHTYACMHTYVLFCDFSFIPCPLTVSAHRIFKVFWPREFDWEIHRHPKVIAFSEGCVSAFVCRWERGVGVTTPNSFVNVVVLQTHFLYLIFLLPTIQQYNKVTVGCVSNWTFVCGILIYSFWSVWSSLCDYSLRPESRINVWLSLMYLYLAFLMNIFAVIVLFTERRLYV